MSSKKKNAIVKVKDTMVDIIDVNGDGKIDIEDIITSCVRVPGVKINREAFLRDEFFKRYPEDMIEEAIKSNPSRAGISKEDIDIIANQVIQHERIGVTGLSAALGMPGGLAMAATIPADLVQYYGRTLRAAQKLL